MSIWSWGDAPPKLTARLTDSGATPPTDRGWGASEMQIHERGSLWKSIRASASLPGVFVPVLDKSSILVDGGIVTNLPCDIMRERSCRRVLVVDVGSVREFTFKSQEIPSPWNFLRSRILPFTKRIEVPNIGDVLMRTTDVGSSQKTREVKKDADLCLRPPSTATASSSSSRWTRSPMWVIDTRKRNWRR